MVGVKPHTGRRGRTERRVGAFFDVDKTILSENSGTLYLKALYDRGEVDWQTLIANLGSYVQYKLNLLDLDRWTKRTMQQFKGRSERALVRDANRWFREYVEPTIYPEAVELVQEHAERGHVVAIVSGATKFVLRPLADHLRIKHVMHTHLEVRDGPVVDEEGALPEQAGAERLVRRGEFRDHRRDHDQPPGSVQRPD